MAANAASGTNNDLVLEKSRVYGTTLRAIFRSTTSPGLWYAETVMSDANRAPDKNPYTWTTPPRRINLANARPNYTKGIMTSAKYVKKTSSYFKQMDHLRYATSLFGTPFWIKDIMLREIDNCEMLRKHAHPNICRYLGVDYGLDLGITALLFKRYDMNLSDLVCDDGRVFDAAKCLGDIRKGILHIHSLGYVHCDIKPENIFVDVKARLFVIGDFDSMQQQGALLDYKCGTPDWALEKADTRGYRVSFEQDWFGFAMVSAWVMEKGGGKRVRGRVYPSTKNILQRAKRKFALQQRTKELAKQEEVKKAEAAKTIKDAKKMDAAKQFEAANKLEAATKAKPIPKAAALKKIQAARKTDAANKAKAILKTHALKKIAAAKAANPNKPTYSPQSLNYQKPVVGKKASVAKPPPQAITNNQAQAAKRTPSPIKKARVPKKLRVGPPP
jgi:hypothetical protein